MGNETTNHSFEATPSTTSSSMPSDDTPLATAEGRKGEMSDDQLGLTTVSASTQSSSAISDDVNAQLEEDKKINKAIKFWCHPLLQNVPPDEKRIYLQERGITDKMLHKAWDRMISLEEEQKLDDRRPQKRSGTTAAAGQDPISPLVPTTGTAQQTPQGQQPPRYHNSNPVEGYSSIDQNPGLPPQPYPAATNMMVQQYGSNHHNHLLNGDDDVAHISVAHGVSLLAVGGLLGLTAAAAVRWLNGGEFEIFPSVLTEGEVAGTTEQGPASSSYSRSKRMVLQQGQIGSSATGLDEQYESVNYSERVHEQQQQAATDEEYDDQDEYEDECDDLADLQVELIDRIEALTEKIEHNSSMQETILKKVSVSSSAFAGQSVNLLRRASDVSTADSEMKTKTSSLDMTSLLSQLNDVKSNLSDLSERILVHTNGDSEEIKNDATSILFSLNSCIEKVQTAVDSESKTSEKATKTTISEHAASPLPSRPNPSSSIDADTEKDVQSLSVDMSTINEKMSLHACIKSIAKNDIVAMRVGCQLLYLYLVNLAGKPDSPRYRTIYTSNESFQKVGSLVGGRDLLKAVGFQDDEDAGALQWLPSAIGLDEMTALASVREAAAALSILKSGKPSAESTALALTKLSPERDFEDVEVVPLECNQTSQPEQEPQLPNDHEMSTAPQTPVGSSLVSPPLPKKMPFMPSGTPTNLAERMENSKE